jgi:hypothetical protein
VLHRSEEVDREERELGSALVTIVGGCHPVVSIADVRHWLQVQFNIPSADIQIRRFFPEDFLISFSFYDDMLRVLHDPLPSVAPFLLVLKRWRRQALASTESLLYQVTVAICGLPAHVWSLASARQILGKSCSNLQRSAATVAKADLRRFVVMAWCVHPDLMPGS